MEVEISDKYEKKNCDVLSVFKIPIAYLKNNLQLDDKTIVELELNSLNKDDSSNSNNEKKNSSVYGKIFNTHGVLSQQIGGEMAKYYTTDTKYLKNTQKFLQSMPAFVGNSSNSNEECYTKWRSIKEDTSFNNKYGYIGWKGLEFINTQPTVMQIICSNDLLSPLFTCIFPILFAFLPVLLLLPNMSFIECMMVALSATQIGKLIFFGSSMNNTEKLWCVVSIGAFVVAAIQGFLGSKRTIKNLQDIQHKLDAFNRHVNSTIQSIKLTQKLMGEIKNIRVTHGDFCAEMERHLKILHTISADLSTVCLNNADFFSTRMFLGTGNMLSVFYKMYADEEYHNTFLFSFGYNAYMENLREFHQKITQKEVNITTFVSKSNPILKINGAVHPLIPNSKNNNVNLPRVSIISGANASGKTTMLKSIFINTLLSQQYGYGFFKTFKMTPYSMLHCYLNISDTSNDDSLFQAEARQCKDILENIKTNEGKKHLAIFDELFSGTNPNEAEECSTATLKYLAKMANVTAIITTHYINTCDNLDNVSGVSNYYMGNDYKITEGISKKNGGCKVLKELEFPEEILDDLKI